MDRKYSQRNNNICRIYIYSEERSDPVYISRAVSTKLSPQAVILIDEPVYLKDARSVAGLS